MSNKRVTSVKHVIHCHTMEEMWNGASGCSSIVPWQCQERQEELAPTPPLTPRNRSASAPGARPEVRDTVKDVMFRFHIPRTCRELLGGDGLEGLAASHVEWVRSLEAHWSVCSLQSKNASFTKFLELLWWPLRNCSRGPGVSFDLPTEQTPPRLPRKLLRTMTRSIGLVLDAMPTSSSWMLGWGEMEVLKESHG